MRGDEAMLEIESGERQAVLPAALCAECKAQKATGAELADLRADLVELERKLIPLLNRVRALLGKPSVVTQERPLDARGKPP